MLTLWLIAIIFAGAALATAMVRASAGRFGLIDTPNARSSHVVAVPRGGGLSIVVLFLAALLCLAAAGLMPWRPAIALMASGTLIAAVGLWDDVSSVPAGRRLLLHFAAAGLGLGLLGGMPPVAFTAAPVEWGWLGHGLALTGLVWMLNLFNFMDGINGIAGLEAVTVAVGAAALLALAGEGAGALPPLLLAAAAAGFLLWNFPTARIFMGDVGSGFLGLIFGLLIVHWAGSVPAMFWSVPILLGCFVVDASYTLLVRLVGGHRPHEAHRSHAYQAAARRFRSHTIVTLSVAVINIVWLLPVAALVVGDRISGPLGLLTAYSPLLAVVIYFKAGAPEGEQRRVRVDGTDAPH